MNRCAAFRAEICLCCPGLQPDCRITREQVRSRVLYLHSCHRMESGEAGYPRAAFQSIVRLIQEIVTRFRVGCNLIVTGSSVDHCPLHPDPRMCQRFPKLFRGHK